MPRNILVADDDIDSRIILRAILERGGFTVQEAGTADQALELAQRSGFDLVIMNYPMLDRDGVTLARRLRSLPTMHEVPILNITSRVVPQYILQAAAEGVDVTLAKPTEVGDTLRVIERMTATVITAS